MAQPTRVQANTGTATGNITVTFAAGPTQGNLLLVFACTGSAQAPTISGWAEVGHVEDSTPSNRMTVLGKIAGAAEPAAVDIVVSGVISVVILEVAPATGVYANVADAIADSDFLGGTTNALTGTTATSAPAVEAYLVAALGANGVLTTPAVDAPFTIRETIARIVTADQTVVAGSYAATFTWTTTARRWATAILAIKNPSGGSGPFVINAVYDEVPVLL